MAVLLDGSDRFSMTGIKLLVLKGNHHVPNLWLRALHTRNCARTDVVPCVYQRSASTNTPITHQASPDGWAVWSAVVFTHWWLLVDHCVLRNWNRILVRAVKGLIYRAGMVSICPLLWQRDVKLQQPKPITHQTIHRWLPHYRYIRSQTDADEL